MLRQLEPGITSAGALAEQRDRVHLSQLLPPLRFGRQREWRYREASLGADASGSRLVARGSPRCRTWQRADEWRRGQQVLAVVDNEQHLLRCQEPM